MFFRSVFTPPMFILGETRNGMGDGYPSFSEYLKALAADPPLLAFPGDFRRGILFTVK